MIKSWIALFFAFLQYLWQRITTATTQARTANQTTVAIILIAVSAILLFIFAYLIFPPLAVDWSAWYEGGRELLSGRTPYKAEIGFFNPPWILLPLMPLIVLPEALGAALVFVIGFLSYALVVRKMGGGPLATALVLLSPPVITDLYFVNINWLVALGFIMPARYGLFLVLAKPHVGIGVALYWLFDSWRKGGIKQVVSDFAPVTVALVLSFVIFGDWMSKSAGLTNITFAQNISMWPMSLPFGLALLLYAIREKKLSLSIIASPLLSPYLLMYAFSGVFVALAKRPWELLVMSCSLWLLVLL